MIKIINGNLFDTEARFICHQVNCMGKMGSGIAYQVKRKYPHVYKEYIKIASPDMLGKVQYVPVNTEYIGHSPEEFLTQNQTQWICNLFAQNNYGRDGKQYTSLDAFRQCLQNLWYTVHAKNNNFGAKIALPYNIGCCRGGANWEDINAIIKQELYDCDVELWKLDNN